MTVKSLLVKIGADVSEFDRAINAISSKTKTLGAGLQKVGMGLTAAVTLPLVGLGVAAAKAALDVDDAMDIIRIGTGATGKALASLEASAKAVGKTVPQNIQAVSQAIADLNTRTGLTGPALERMAKLTLDAARMMGIDSTELVSSFTRTLGDWAIELEAAPAALDMLFTASQATGIGLDQLNRSLVAYGAPLRQMGFDFETAAALVGKFEKEGVNAELVMGSLRIALGTLARQGKPVVESFRAMMEKIKETGDSSEANRLALELFGARAGPDMAAAIREGRFEIDDLVKSLRASGNAIQSANDDTRGFAEIWAETKNKILLALEPLGKMFLAFAENWLPKIASIVEAVAGAFNRLPGPAKAALIVFGALAAALGPVLIIVGKLILLAPAMGAAWTMLAGPIGLVAVAIAGLVAVGVLVYKNWEKIKGWFVALWTYIKTFFIAAWKTIESVFGGVIKTIVSWFSFLYNTLKTIAAAIGSAVIGAFRWLRDSAVSIFQAVADFVIGKLLWLMEQIAKIPIIKKFVKNLQEGLAAAKASIAESRERMKESTEGMADDAAAAGGKIEASYDGIGESAGQMKTVLSSVHAELVDVIKKGTLSEIEYARWAVEETYALRKKAIEEELTDARARGQELKILAQARGVELAAIEKSFRDKELQGKIDFAKRIKEQEQQMALDQIEALKTYATQRQAIQDGINQMTMTALQFELLKLDEERLAKEAHIAGMKELSDAQRAEDLAALAAYYALKREQAEAAASEEFDLAVATREALEGVYLGFVDNMLSAFQVFGEGTRGILGAVGAAFKSTVNMAISALKQLVMQELTSAKVTVGAEQAKGISRVISSVMALPFPLNLALVGGAIAAVSALFSAIKLGEGGIVMGPRLAVVGDKPEAIIPLSKLGMFTAGESRDERPTIMFNLNSPLIMTTGLTKSQVDELAPYLFKSIEEQAHRFGFLVRK